MRRQSARHARRQAVGHDPREAAELWLDAWMPRSKSSFSSSAMIPARSTAAGRRRKPRPGCAQPDGGRQDSARTRGKSDPVDALAEPAQGRCLLLRPCVAGSTHPSIVRGFLGSNGNNRGRAPTAARGSNEEELRSAQRAGRRRPIPRVPSKPAIPPRIRLAGESRILATPNVGARV